MRAFPAAMVFSSPLFLACFLPVLLGLYALSPARGRNALLLAASLLFYAWGEPRAVLLMLGAIGANYAVGRAIGRRLPPDAAAPAPRSARLWLALGVAADLAALGTFKYASFAANNLQALGIPVPDPRIALPIGVSFFLFQCISYLADVYRRAIPAERSLPAFALYVSLFPQLIAGPIVRYETIRGQMRDRTLRADDAAEGLRRFGRGLAKKVLLADTLAKVADAAFPPDLSGLPQAFAWAGALCYALQIYYDFSGYSDMAIGLGRVFGFRFLENFDHPYCAASVREFWRRWHISLSTWFRDYLYIPLGGSRRGAARTYLNLVLVFALCGLWHGASWCFVLWGLWHGAGLVAERLLAAARRRRAASAPRAPAPGAEPPAPWTVALLGNLYVWLFSILGWVPFKAGMEGYGAGYAARYLRLLLLGSPGHPLASYWPAMECYTHAALVAALAGLLLCYPRPAARLAPTGRTAGAYAASFALFLAAYAFAMTSGYSPFIYFRF